MWESQLEPSRPEYKLTLKEGGRLSYWEFAFKLSVAYYCRLESIMPGFAASDFCMDLDLVPP